MENMLRKDQAQRLEDVQYSPSDVIAVKGNQGIEEEGAEQGGSKIGLPAAGRTGVFVSDGGGPFLWEHTSHGSPRSRMISYTA